MSIKLVTAPDVEPVTLDDVGGQCRADLTSEAGTVNGYITAIRQRVENDLRRALITQTVDLVLDAFPISTARNPFAAVEIPLPPLQSVVSVKYTDTYGVVQTLANTEYVVNTDSTPGRVMPAYGKVWPATLDFPGAVRVQFVAGYGGPVAWDVAAVYAIGAHVLYTDGNTYRKTATTAAGVVCTDLTKWALDHPGYAVPQCIRNWMLLNIAAMYENRESIIIGQGGVIELNTLADSLLDPERWEVRV